MSKTSNSFFTQGYKGGFIHTHMTADGKEKVQTQIGSDLKQHKTFVGAQRYITKVTKENSKNV